MKPHSIKENAEIAAMREFNRFYTARFGLLGKRYLDGGLSLTEARMVYEIGSHLSVTGSSLQQALALDAGYVSHSLAKLISQKLVLRSRTTDDRRKKLLRLSPAGRYTLAQLNEQSASQIQGLLAQINATDRNTLLDSLARVRSILDPSDGSFVRIVRLTATTDDVVGLLREYYEAVNVVQRDSPEAIRRIVIDPSSGVWLAYLKEKAVGCVMLRTLSYKPFSGECKRLYVRPEERGKGIADKLLDAQEEFARSEKLRWIYLDSDKDLKVAINLYRKRGFVACKRFNDNPQATVFLRKRIDKLGRGSEERVRLK